MKLLPSYGQLPENQAWIALACNLMRKCDPWRALEKLKQVHREDLPSEDLYWVSFTSARCNAWLQDRKSFEREHNLLKELGTPSKELIFLEAEMDYSEGFFQEALKIINNFHLESVEFDSLKRLCLGRSVILLQPKDSLKILKEINYESLEPWYRDAFDSIYNLAEMMVGIKEPDESIQRTGWMSNLPEAQLWRAFFLTSKGDYSLPLKLQGNNYPKELEIYINLLNLRLSIETLEPFDLCKSKLESFLKKYGHPSNLKWGLALSGKPAHLNYQLFRVFISEESEVEIAIETIHSWIVSIKNHQTSNEVGQVFSLGFLYCLKGYFYEKLQNSTKAAFSYLKAAERNYWDGEVDYGFRNFEKTEKLDQGLSDLYWYWADSAYLSSFSIADTIEKMERLKIAQQIWEKGYIKDPPKMAWPFITMSRIAMHQAYILQHDNGIENVIKSMLYCSVALILEPNNKDWSGTLASLFNGLNFNCIAYALSLSVLGKEPNDPFSIENALRSTISFGDLKKASTYMEPIKSINPVFQEQCSIYEMYLAGELDNATSSLKKLVSQADFKEDKWARYSLCVISWLKGDMDFALEQAKWFRNKEVSTELDENPNELTFVSLLDQRDIIKRFEKNAKLIGNPILEPSLSINHLLLLLFNGQIDKGENHFCQLLNYPLIGLNHLYDIKLFLKRLVDYSKSLNQPHHSVLEEMIGGENSGWILEINRIQASLSPELDPSNAKVFLEMKKLQQILPSANFGGMHWASLKLAEVYLSFLLEGKVRPCMEVLLDVHRHAATHIPVPITAFFISLIEKLKSSDEYWEIDEYINSQTDLLDLDVILKEWQEVLSKFVQTESKISDSTSFSPLVVDIHGPSLIPEGMIEGQVSTDDWSLFKSSLPKYRNQFLERFGWEMPAILFRPISYDQPEGTFIIQIHGVSLFLWQVRIGFCYLLDIHSKNLVDLGVKAEAIIEEPIPLDPRPGCWVENRYQSLLKDNGLNFLDNYDVIMEYLCHVVEREASQFVDSDLIHKILLKWHLQPQKNHEFEGDDLNRQAWMGKLIRRLISQRVPLADYPLIIKQIESWGEELPTVTEAANFIREILPTVHSYGPYLLNHPIYLDADLEDQLSGLYINTTVEQMNGANGYQKVIMGTPNEIQEALNNIRTCITDQLLPNTGPWPAQQLVITSNIQIRNVSSELLAYEFPQLTVITSKEFENIKNSQLSGRFDRLSQKLNKEIKK
ncbi:FHIPEP family type III secretion protein [Aquiflexum lacus]|uniref:FHIPEP family type III secretion protein n=1 Tax=Aquiflexum lacus TaxID=2483805 RepID=UPI0018954F86|nr:FHIPEP family type III secretion protein [Aquiflexum lacus]